MKIFNKIHFQEHGASLVEYALLVALISCVSIGAISGVGGATANSLQTAANALDGGTASGAGFTGPGSQGLAD